MIVSVQFKIARFFYRWAKSVPFCVLLEHLPPALLNRCKMPRHPYPQKSFHSVPNCLSCMARGRGMDQMTSSLPFQFLELNIKEMPGKAIATFSHFFNNKHLLNPSSKPGTMSELEHTKLETCNIAPNWTLISFHETK